jgi:integrase
MKVGVEPREKSIRFRYTIDGVVYRKTLQIKPTPANIKYAQRTAGQIEKAIKSGTFNVREYFPDDDADPESFGQVAKQWLAARGQLASATLSQYANALKVWEQILGADTQMSKLTYQVLSAKIGGHPWASGKLANNYLIVLRGVMAHHYAGARAGENPMIGIENMTVVKKLPDPLTADERDRVLEDLRKRYDARVWAYFQFAFYTGMRPEELIALQWGDIGWATKQARVQRVRTFGGEEREGSKTHAERDVDLVPMALAALEALKPHTFMKGGDIFESPVTGRPWHDERSQRDTFWAPCLKRLGIRQRRAYATRHTYATVALMGGVRPPYIARQLGHATTEMPFKVYAKWIDGADGGQERRRMEEAMCEKKLVANAKQGV